ncbi:MAG: hydroxyacid dehydrogenase, partial [Blastomonas sp.]|nr:hydroxyacid dehydrogenase [Blastomonas sp.]
AAISASESQAEAFWKLRDSISEAERAHGPAMQHDISVPVAAMAQFILDAGVAVEARFPGTEVAAFGHMGDGNVHFHVAAPKGADPRHWPDNPGKEISGFVHDLVVAAGGSISAEHGIGQMKRDELERLSDPARLGAMKAIKRALDPHGIMNPGKLIVA